MIKTIVIIEDERPNVNRLERLLATVRPMAKVICVLESVSETVSWLSNHPEPDLILMDIRLPDGLSFEVFSQVPVKCPVIFTTAYDEYALKAFKHNGVDYLLKPVEQQELNKAISKAEHFGTGVSEESLKGLFNQYFGKQSREKFLVPYRDGFKTVMVRDIDYFQSEARITRAKLSNGTEEILNRTLEQLEAELDTSIFFRANRQLIIRLDTIGQIHNYFNNRLKIVLSNHPDLEIIISREKASEFRSWMDY